MHRYSENSLIESLFENSKRQKIALMLAPLCFGGHGELSCAIKFANVYSRLTSCGETSLARKVLSIGVEELAHLSKLLAIIDDLGYSKAIKSVMFIPDKSSLNVKRFTERQIFLDALCAKRALIHDYEKLIKTLGAGAERKVLKEIIDQEKEHEKQFEQVVLSLT